MAKQIKINKNKDIKSLIQSYSSDLAVLYKSGYNMMGRNAKAAVRTCEAYTMYSLVRNFKYENILEIGTGTGFSSLIFAKALVDEGFSSSYRDDERIYGTVDTIDINEDSPNIFQNNFGKFREYIPELESMITFYNKDSSELIPFLDKQYDLAFIDGCHDYECVKADYENVLKKIRKGGCIVFHDVVETPNYKQGIWDVVEEIKQDNEVFHLTEEIFDYFSFEEDVNDANRMRNKWNTKDYLSWALETKHNPKNLLAFTFVK